MQITVKLLELSNAGTGQYAIAGEACRHMERAFNDPAFGQCVAMAEYRETRFRDEAGWRSITPADLPPMFAQGVERGTAADGQIDLKVNLDGLRREFSVRRSPANCRSVPPTGS